jgi:hypothetical protein
MIIIDPVIVTDAVLTSTNVPNEFPSYLADGVYGPDDQVIVDAADLHDVYRQLAGVTMAVTLTIATPCVVTKTAHGLLANAPIKLNTTGALPTGITAGATYYVLAPTTNTFNISATPGGAAIATTGSQSGIHTLTSNSIGHYPLTSPTYWVRVGVKNALKMFDAFNNTATENPESIVVVLDPVLLATGIYLSVDADDIEIEMEDALDGVVFQRTEDLITSNSGSSFWNWYFRRIVRKNWFLAIDMPMYAGATITVSINKPGGIAKCWMASVGSVNDIGGTFWGVGEGIEDYSDSDFDVDGTSTDVIRGFAKTLECDIEIETSQRDGLLELFASYRRRPLVWIMSPDFSPIFGVYQSFKTILSNLRKSRMSLEIKGKI